jgi:hypothetical protein
MKSGRGEPPIKHDLANNTRRSWFTIDSWEFLKDVEKDAGFPGGMLGTSYREF